MNNVAACVFSDMRYQLIEMGEAQTDAISADVFHVMADSLLYPPATNGETVRGIADFERYIDQSCEFDPT